MYIVRRTLLLLPTFVLGTSLIFFALRVLPGDELTLIIGEAVVAPEDRARLEERYGLDDPLWERYIDFIVGVAQGDLGNSNLDGLPVMDKIRVALPVTLELVVLATVVSLTVAIPIGVVSAIYRDTPLDYVLRIGANVGLATPTFWSGTVVLLALTLWVGWTPGLRYTPIWKDPVENLGQFVVPALILGLALAASVMRLTRSVMLDVLNEDYVRTARAKGLRDRTVIMRHALRNALLPVVTVLGVQLTALIGGTVVLESIYALPGSGSLLIRALNNRDFEVVQGVNVIVLFVVLVMNLLVDLSYTLLDPRVKLAD